MKPEHLASHLQRLLEVGRVLSKENESKVRAALAALQDVLAKLASGDEVDAAKQKDATEAARAVLEANLSLGDRESLVRSAIRASVGVDDETWVWMVDCYDSNAIYQVERSGAFDPGTRYYQVDYAIVDGKVTLGTPAEVQRVVSYVPVTQAEGSAGVEIDGDCVPLVEQAIRRDGSAAIKLIQPGWGSSGYYSPQVLERDGPSAFPAGLKMYWNHPTRTEESERPERDLRDLAAEITSGARWEAQGPAGPGLYADAKVFGPYTEAVNELAPHIGVSIRAIGRAKPGEAEGRRGAIIEQITAGQSVDFVTTPGAGGQILQLFEAARGRAFHGRVEVTEEEARKLREAQAALDAENARLRGENAQLREGQLLREARDYVAEVLAGVQLPDVTKARLTESLAKSPAVKDGKLDRDAYKAQIEEAVKTETEYLARVTGAGQIRGMGSAGNGSAGVTAEGAQKTIESAFARMGLSESTARIAAAGRV